MLSAERRRLPREIGGFVEQLTGRVPESVMRRAAELGGIIPPRGPGSYSILNALKVIWRDASIHPSQSQTKEERRKWNLSHQGGLR